MFTKRGNAYVRSKYRMQCEYRMYRKYRMYCSNVFVMLVVCINHGLLAHFTFLRVSREAAEFRGLGTGDMGGML